MRIDIVCPVSDSSTRGNGVTARRWANILTGLGHTVSISNSFDNAVDPNTQCVVGIHATRSSAILQAVKQRQPDATLLVCLSGTDLNRDLAQDESNEAYQRAARSLTIADRVILLEPEGCKGIQDRTLRELVLAKSIVIYQSASAVDNTKPAQHDAFVVSVIGHLRPVKDPFRTALAAEQLPDDSMIEVVHFGQALSDEMCEQAIAMDRANSRYRWVGNRPHADAMQQLAQSRATVLSSLSEGAPSIISEAVVNSVPILATRIPATIGLLGSDYPGFFEIGSTDQLTDLLNRLEKEPSFADQLKDWLKQIAGRFSPEQEQLAWKTLLSSLE